MLIKECMFCSTVYGKIESPSNGVSHGMCDVCSGIYFDESTLNPLMTATTLWMEGLFV